MCQNICGILIIVSFCAPQRVRLTERQRQYDGFLFAQLQNLIHCKSLQKLTAGRAARCECVDVRLQQVSVSELTPQRPNASVSLPGAATYQLKGLQFTAINTFPVGGAFTKLTKSSKTMTAFRNCFFVTCIAQWRTSQVNKENINREICNLT